MKIREFRPSDAETICSWTKSEEDMYKWSANQIARYPFGSQDLISYFENSQVPIVPLTAYDENGNEEVPVGHLFIRWPSEDKSVIRFGFIIVDPELRGQGAGRKLVELGAEYGRDVLGARVATLGVFLNNPAARYCYEAAGFVEEGDHSFWPTVYGDWECAEMKKDL